MSPPAFIDATAPIYGAERESVHVSVMRRLGAHRIVSTDTDFDRLPDVVRLSPPVMSQ